LHLQVESAGIYTEKERVVAVQEFSAGGAIFGDGVAGRGNIGFTYRAPPRLWRLGQFRLLRFGIINFLDYMGGYSRQSFSASFPGEAQGSLKVGTRFVNAL